jgi:RNA polymerase sigma-70 factor (ECF subfamily)
MEADEARTLYDRGRSRWPTLPLQFEEFFDRVQPHLATLSGVDPSDICAEDLFLVAACLSRLDGAVDQFDALVWPQLERHVRRREGDPERLAEMRQVLLVRLFVPGEDGAPPRIAEYTGRGPLLVWLRMAATRLLTDWRRGDARLASLPDSLPLAIDRDVELSFIRGRYEQDFAVALRAALESLDDEVRLLLQLCYRERLTSDQIAVLLKTSRATAQRRVASARDALAAQLRQRLQSRLQLSQTGLEQLMGLLSSTLVPSLAAELRSGLAARP